MKPSRVADCLDHMLEAAGLACSYVEGMAREDFDADKRTQQAVILNLIVLGEEAAKLLKDEEAFANLPPRSTLAQHERHAQSHRTWLLRDQP
jgi:uncharacterized protein with HEPN domain